jgi:GlpG protein
VYNTPKRRGVTRIETALTDDLLPFSAYLWSQRIAHRIYEQQDRQVLEVLTAGADDRVLTDYRAWRDGKLVLKAVPRRPAGAWLATVREAVTRYPTLIVMTIAALVLYPATWAYTDHDEIGSWLPLLTFVDVTEPARERFDALAMLVYDGEWWRLITPAFLHFSLIHLGFNLAVVFGFGLRIERAAGSVAMVLAVVSIAAVSNLVQFLATPNGWFGGLSGVAYGLIGYVVARGRLEPWVRAWRTPPALVISLATFLVLMTTGLTEFFGLYIANAAHWAGLVFGVLLGWIAGRRALR